MAFRINTNLDAMTALNSLNAVGQELSTSIQRLSTGLQINSAADNPSGLIAATTFNQEIGGINQAIQNNQNAINYTKTAEGAFNQVTTLLNTAYSIAVGSANSATLTQSQISANNAQLQSIISSIDTIASNTQFGSKYLLNGSAGIQSSIANTNNISALNIGGTFNGVALTSTSAVSLTAVTAATLASTTVVDTAITGLASNDSFTMNGVTFTATKGMSVGAFVNMINNATSQTGITASDSGTTVTLAQTTYGSGYSLNIADSGSLLTSGTVKGTDAAATMKIGTASVAFTGGLNGNDGLTLTDANGNTFTLTTAGNVTSATAATIGEVIAGTSQFQVGANSGQTSSLSLSNYSSQNLGTGVVTGFNMSNIDVLSASDASTAMSVIQKAIQDVSTARGSIGNFQDNVLTSNINSLTSEQQNLSATLSTLQDTNVAQEMTNYTKYQIIEQAGLAVLGQANMNPSQIVGLLQKM